MYVVFIAGGIASGKSTVASELERLGAWRIDLDDVSRAVLEPGSFCLADVIQSFGDDLVDPQTGSLNRSLLAQRAFADETSSAILESIELPYIKDMLVRMLEGGPATAFSPAVCVVEVPLLDRMGDLMDLADEVVVVVSDLNVRRQRAIARGMLEADFDHRVAGQPTDDYLRAHATTIIENYGGKDALLDATHEWWRSHGWT